MTLEMIMVRILERILAKAEEKILLRAKEVMFELHSDWQVVDLDRAPMSSICSRSSRWEQGLFQNKC